MTAMWAPISWTIIFGLTFATFLTLIVVPVMYRIAIIAQKFIMTSSKRYAASVESAETLK